MQLGEGEPVRNRAPSIIVAGTTIAAAGMLTLWAIVPAVDLPTEAVFLVVILFAAGISAAVTMALPDTVRTAVLRIKLGPWMGLGFAATFGIGTWYVHSPMPTVVLSPEILFAAAVIALVGLVCVTAGYRATPAFIIRGFASVDSLGRGRTGRAATLSGVLVLWFIGMAATVLQFRWRTLGYLADPTAALNTRSSANAALAAFAYFGSLATLLTAWMYGRNPRTDTRLVLGAVASTQIIAGLFSGYKEPVVIQLIAIMLGYGLTRRVRLVAVAIAASFVLVFVFPFVAQYRQHLDYGSTRLTPEQALSGVDFRTLASDTLEDSKSNDIVKVPVERLSRIVDVAVIRASTPDPVTYKPTTELLAGPLLGLVPRSLWPEKPVLAAGLEMSHVYYGMPDYVYTFSAMTPYGDLWRHGGLIVVAIGMAILGVFLRSVDGRPGDAAEDPTLLFLPFMLLAIIAKQEMDYLTMSAGIPQALVTSWIATRIVTAARASRGDLPETVPAVAAPARASDSSTDS